MPPSLATSFFTTWSSLVCCSCGCPFSQLPLSCGPSRLSPLSLLLFCLCCFRLCFDQCFWSRSPSGTKIPRGASKITPTFNNLLNTLRKSASMSSGGQAVWLGAYHHSSPCMLTHGTALNDSILPIHLGNTCSRAPPSCKSVRQMLSNLRPISCRTLVPKYLL